jgi:acyl carrier protein
MDYLSTVRDFVIESFLFGDEERLDDDTSFIESGIVDSTGILELVAFLEETFEIIIEDEEVVPDNLDRLNNIVRFLQKKLDGKATEFS